MLSEKLQGKEVTMSVSDGNISKPVRILADIKAFFGINDNRMSVLLRNDKINKWSKYKPIKSTAKVNLTKNDIIAARAGLVPSQPLTVLRSAITPNGISSPVDKTVSEVTAQIFSYSYNRPTGGNYPFRLLDFNGYDHNTTPPDNGAKDLAIRLDSFNQHTNAGQTYVGDSSNIYNWSITSPVLYAFGNIGVKLGENSTENVGFNGSSNAIPLPWIFAQAGDCRLGVAIKLKSSSISTISNKWILFVGQKTLNTSNTPASMIPSISTNIRMYRELVNQCTLNQNRFSMIPVLVEKIRLDFVALEGSNGSVLQSNLIVTSETNIYPFPSGAKDVTFTLSKGDPNPSIPGADVIYSNAGWSLAQIFTGSYVQIGTGSSNRYPVNNWAIIAKYPPTRDETVTVTLRTGAVSSVNGVPTWSYTDIYRRSITIVAGRTFEMNGYTFNGATMGGGPGLAISGYQGKEDNYEIIVS